MGLLLKSNWLKFLIVMPEELKSRQFTAIISVRSYISPKVQFFLKTVHDSLVNLAYGKYYFYFAYNGRCKSVTYKTFSSGGKSGGQGFSIP